MTREIKTGLSDSRVGYNSVVDHRSRRPVLSYTMMVSNGYTKVCSVRWANYRTAVRCTCGPDEPFAVC